MFHHRGDSIKHQVHLTADHVGARARAAAVGDVHQVHPSHAFEQLPCHVVRRARPTGRVIYLARLGFGAPNEVGQRFVWQTRVGHQHQIRKVERCHGDKITQQRKRFVGDQCFIDGVGVGHQQQRVAIGRGFGRNIGPDGRARAGFVVHHE